MLICLYLSIGDLLKGNFICAIVALCYGISNILQEYLVRQSHSVHYLGLLGFFGVIFSSFQKYLYSIVKLYG